jgi:Yip1 domain
MNGQSSASVFLYPWVTIWTSPRATIRRIVDSDPRRQVLFVMWLAGVLSALNSTLFAYSGGLPAGFPEYSPVLSAVLVILGGFVSILLLYVFGSLFRWSGGMLGGTAETVEVRAALAWSEIPAIYLATPGIALTLLGYDIEPGMGHWLSPYHLLAVAVAIWASVIWLKCLGKVHHFSAWRALGAVLLGTIVALVAVFGFLAICFLAARFGHLLV